MLDGNGGVTSWGADEAISQSRRTSSFRHRIAILQAARVPPHETAPETPTTSIHTNDTPTSVNMNNNGAAGLAVEVGVSTDLEPQRGPPPVYTLPSLYYPNTDPATNDTCSSTTRPDEVVASLWLQKSPFAPFRSHSVAMVPADRPWEGDPASIPEAIERQQLAEEEAARGRLPGRFVSKEELEGVVEAVEDAPDDEESESGPSSPLLSPNDDTCQAISKRRLYIPDRFPRSAINNDPTQLVTPNSLDPLPNHRGNQMKISRANPKNMGGYRHLYFVLPDLSVRFSALMAILKVSGLEELRASNIVAMLDVAAGGKPKLKKKTAIEASGPARNVPGGGGGKAAMVQGKKAPKPPVNAAKDGKPPARPSPPPSERSTPKMGAIAPASSTTATACSPRKTFSIQQRFSSMFRAGMTWSEKLDALHSYARDKALESPLWSLRWCKRMHSSEYGQMRPYQRVNHFPATWGIGRKDNLHKRLKKFSDLFGEEQVYFFPAAFLLPQDSATLKRDMQMRRFPPAGQKDNVYIVKQVASACGRGMHLLKGRAQPNRVRLPEGQWLVQRYIHDPFLIDGFKFDLRIYVLVTSFNPLRVYLFEDGLVRFATTPYPVATEGTSTRTAEETPTSDASTNNDEDEGVDGDGSDAEGADRLPAKSRKGPLKKKKTKSNVPDFKMKDVSAHLTNYSVNKHTSNFVQPDAAGGGAQTANEGEDDDDDDDTPDDERGSKWVISTLKRYLEQKRGIPFAPIWRAVVDVILKTLISVEADVNSQMRLLFSSGGGASGGGGGSGVKASSALGATAVGGDGRPLPHASLVHRPGTAINSCFELYGFDILLRDKPMVPVAGEGSAGEQDSRAFKCDPRTVPQLTPVLMEVNIMPSLHTRASTLDQRVKANMMANMLNLVGVYSARKKYKNTVPSPCPCPQTYAGPSAPATDKLENELGVVGGGATATGEPSLSPTAGAQPPQPTAGLAMMPSLSPASLDGESPSQPIWERQTSLLPFPSSSGGFPFTSTAQDQTGGVPPAAVGGRRGSAGGGGADASLLRPMSSSAIRSTSCGVSAVGAGRRAAALPVGITASLRPNQPRFSSGTGGSGSTFPPPPPPRSRSAKVSGGTPTTPTSATGSPTTTSIEGAATDSTAPAALEGTARRSSSARPLRRASAPLKPSIYDLHQFFRSLAPVEMDVVCQAEEELDRRGSFTRIFPPMPVPPTSLLYDPLAIDTTQPSPQPAVLMSSQGWEGYRRFYVEPRPYNELLHRWEYIKLVDPPKWLQSTTTVGGASVARRVPDEEGLDTGCSSGDEDDKDDSETEQ